MQGRIRVRPIVRSDRGDEPRLIVNKRFDPFIFMSESYETTCCIVGAGPAGAVLALILARQGIATTLLEAHQDFDREFRGDTVHPSVMEIMDEMGLADIVRLQHSLARGSNVGLLATNRNFQGEDAGSVGFDTTMFFTDTLGMTGQLMRVHGPTADGGLAWFLRPAWDTATSHFHIRYAELDTSIQEDINAVGFLTEGKWEAREEWNRRGEENGSGVGLIMSR